MRDGRAVLSNVIASQHDLHRKFGGVVPEIASRAHIERILPAIDEAIEQAGVTLEEVDAIAVGNRPGLIGSLLVGVAAAKTLAWALGKPLIGVDHVRAHLYAGALDNDATFEQLYPALGMVVSGGHTSIYTVTGPMDMKLIGRTIDDAVGEAYDKVAAILNLGFPGGPIVDRNAREGAPEAVKLPRTLLGKDSLDFSFSGLKTAVLYHVRGKPAGRGKGATFDRDASMLSPQEVLDTCASFQAAVADVVEAKLDRARQAMIHQGQSPASIIIGGGVSANSLIRSRVSDLAQRHGMAIYLPKMPYCLDNAAMIAGLAHQRLIAGQFDNMSLEAVATTELR